MKKFITLCVMLLYAVVYSQSLPIEEKSSLDDKLVNIDKSSVTSNIIYQRSATYTALFDYNKSIDFNTADADFFEQSLTDLYYGSKQTLFTDFNGLRNRVLSNKYKDNIIDIGIINTPFHILNYNEGNPSIGGLLFDANTQLFSQISGKAPFFGLHATVIAPLKKYANGTSIVFNFRNDLTFFNGTKTIKNLTVDLGDGINRSIISNGIFSPQSITVNYTTSGEKKLMFSIIYSDNTTLTTNGTFNFQYANNSTAKLSSSMCNGEPLADDFSIISDTAFQGYDESYAFKGKFDYRIFYRTGAIDRKIRKPIIIIDGFDPEDKRKIFACEMKDYKAGETPSIEDMMTYYDSKGYQHKLIQELRNKGYDVTIVNHPTYCIRNTAPYDVIDCNTQGAREINGGADYIERNALTLATLIKSFNAQLKTNGSTEQLAIVGPSMGGQTSRYALAYLEKQGIPHNTRLWISIDSPHLGANIPLGDQALLFLASRKGKSAKATDFYDIQLNSAAAKQQIIDLHKPLQISLPILNIQGLSTEKLDETYLNGKTISQGFSNDSGNPYYQQFYNNQFSNGLPNSKGYPMNLRKIALINGSLTGSKIVKHPNGTILPNGVAGEQVINLRGFTKITISLPIGQYTFTVHIASLESYFMPNYNSGTFKIARLKKGTDYYDTFSRNINSRGSLDELPGGWFKAQDDIVSPLVGHSPLEGVGGSFWGYPLDNFEYWFVNKLGTGYWDLRKLVPTNSFIPSFSSLGIKTPDRNWGESLQRNLVCTNETPFDSYYGSSNNTLHTSFTEESVNWLMKELDGNPQLPWFPIDAANFSGANTICLNSTSTYSFSDICKLPGTPTWSVSSNLQITSSNATGLVVKGLSNGEGTITATFSNGQTLTKKIWVGSPVVSSVDMTNSDGGLSFCVNIKGADRAKYTINTNTPDVLQYKYRVKLSTSSSYIETNENASKTGYIYGFDTVGTYRVEFSVRNICGWSDWKGVNVRVQNCTTGGSTKRTASSKEPETPLLDNSDITVAKSGKTPQSYKVIYSGDDLLSSQADKISILVTDIHGVTIVNTSKLEFNLDGKLPGTYYLKIIRNDKMIYTKTLIVN